MATSIFLLLSSRATSASGVVHKCPLCRLPRTDCPVLALGRTAPVCRDLGRPLPPLVLRGLPRPRPLLLSSTSLRGLEEASNSLPVLLSDN